jgi:hypothetical protein
MGKAANLSNISKPTQKNRKMYLVWFVRQSQVLNLKAIKGNSETSK